MSKDILTMPLSCPWPALPLLPSPQRYKVCEAHLKIDFIERDGQRVRFCQQCGRFQPLDEFDDNKRCGRGSEGKERSWEKGELRFGGCLLMALALHHRGRLISIAATW